MVNKPCSRVCARSGHSRLPSNYRSRSAGSLPRRRAPQPPNYAQYLFNTDEEFADLEKEAGHNGCKTSDRRTFSGRFENRRDARQLEILRYIKNVPI